MKLLCLLASSVLTAPRDRRNDQVVSFVNTYEQPQMTTWVNETEAAQVPVYHEQVATWVNPNEAPQVQSFTNETVQVPVVEEQVPVWVNPNEQPQMEPWVQSNATYTN